MAEERAKKPYLAIPSERCTKVLAIPDMIFQRIAHTTTPPAPTSTRLFLFQNASTCNPSASWYRWKVDDAAASGFSKILFALPASGLNEKNLSPEAGNGFGGAGERGGGLEWWWKVRRKVVVEIWWRWKRRRPWKIRDEGFDIWEFRVRVIWGFWIQQE